MENTINGTSVILINKWIEILLQHVNKGTLYSVELGGGELTMSPENIFIFRILKNIVKDNLDEAGYPNTRFDYRISSLLLKKELKAVEEYLNTLKILCD